MYLHKILQDVSDAATTLSVIHFCQCTSKIILHSRNYAASHECMPLSFHSHILSTRVSISPCLQVIPFLVHPPLTQFQPWLQPSQVNDLTWLLVDWVTFWMKLFASAAGSGDGPVSHPPIYTCAKYEAIDPLHARMHHRDVARCPLYKGDLNERWWQRDQYCTVYFHHIYQTIQCMLSHMFLLPHPIYRNRLHPVKFTLWSPMYILECSIWSRDVGVSFLLCN